MAREVQPPVPQALACETWLAGRLLVRSWCTVRHTKRIVFLCKIEIYPEALHAKGPPSRQEIELTCLPTLQPVRLRTYSSNGKSEIKFGRDRILTSSAGSLPGNASLDFPDLVLPGNTPALFALLVATLSKQRRLPFEGRAFLPAAMQNVDFWIRRASDGAWQTSLGDNFTFNAEGLMDRLVSGDARVVCSASRMPRWQRVKAVGILRKRERIAQVASRQLQTIYGERKAWARLATPRGSSPRACVLFIGGSGLHDRFGMSGTVDLGYGDLALGLARLGVACLQYDKPGAGRTKSLPSTLEPNFDVELELATTWRRWLAREYAGIPIVLVGHSQGGQVALAIAGRGEGCAGISLLATAGRPLAEVLAQQMNLQAMDLGLDRERTDARVEFFRRYLRWVQQHDASFKIPKEFEPLKWMATWYRGVLATAPSVSLPRVSVPLFVVQGDRDIQVAPEDAEELARQARLHGKNVRVLHASGLDHLMKRSEATTNIGKYADRRRRFSSEVIQAIAAWIDSLCAKTPFNDGEPHPDEDRRHE